MGQDGGNTQ